MRRAPHSRLNPSGLGKQPSLLQHLRLLAAPCAFGAPERGGGRSARVAIILSARRLCQNASVKVDVMQAASQSIEEIKASFKVANHGCTFTHTGPNSWHSTWINSLVSKGKTFFFGINVFFLPRHFQRRIFQKQNSFFLKWNVNPGLQRDPPIFSSIWPWQGVWDLQNCDARKLVLHEQTC